MSIKFYLYSFYCVNANERSKKRAKKKKDRKRERSEMFSVA